MTKYAPLLLAVFFSVVAYEALTLTQPYSRQTLASGYVGCSADGGAIVTSMRFDERSETITLHIFRCLAEDRLARASVADDDPRLILAIVDGSIQLISNRTGQ